MIDQSGSFFLKVDLIAAGTQLRVGSGQAEFRAVEDLSLGDEIYDPIQDRLIEITKMACITLDSETTRDRGFAPKRMMQNAAEDALIFAVKVPKTQMRAGVASPIRGQHHLTESCVFFSLGFERKAVVETPTTYCEFSRPNLYALDNIAGRTKLPTRDNVLTIFGR